MSKETVELQSEVESALEAYARDATDAPSPPELVTRIVRDWLISNGYLEADPIEALNDDTEQMPG